MSTIEMNEILVRLYTDDIFRTSFFDNPNKLLDAYEHLGDDEADALKKLSVIQLNSFARSLKYKLMEMIRSNYKVLFDHYYDEFSGLYDSFYSIARHSPDEELSRYALKFGHYILHLYANNEAKKMKYNIVKYCIQKLKARLLDMPPYQIMGAVPFGKNRPILSKAIAVDTYTYNMVDVLKDFNPETFYSSSSHSIIMYMTSGKLKVSEISCALAQFLNYCHGGFSLDEILEKMESCYAQDIIQEQLVPMIPELVRKNYIYFKEVV